jgi:hypothetical protein
MPGCKALTDLLSATLAGSRGSTRAPPTMTSTGPSTRNTTPASTAPHEMSFHAKEHGTNRRLRRLGWHDNCTTAQPADSHPLRRGRRRRSGGSGCGRLGTRVQRGLSRTVQSMFNRASTTYADHGVRPQRPGHWHDARASECHVRAGSRTFMCTEGSDETRHETRAADGGDGDAAADSKPFT